MPFDKLKKYIDVGAFQIDTDWNLAGSNFRNVTNFKMRPCQLDDFGNSSLTDKYFYSWNGFIILCPEKTNSDGKNLTLNGAWGMNQTKSLEFRVERCSDEQGSCESDENIDSFLRDLRIQTWIIQEHIDFRKIDKVPVSK